MNRSRTYRGILLLSGCVFLMLFLCSVPVLWAQETTLPDTLQGPPQGTRASQQQQNVAQAPEQEGQVNFQSSDSLIFVFDTSC